MHVYTEMCTFVSFMKRLSILYCHNNTNKQPFLKKFIFIEQENYTNFFSHISIKIYINQPWVYRPTMGFSGLLCTSLQNPGS